MFSNTRRSINLVLFFIAGIICLAGGILLIYLRAAQTVSGSSVIAPTENWETKLPQSFIIASPVITITPSLLIDIPTQTPSVLPLPPERRGLITNGDRTTNKVALTFDVCQAEGDLSGYDAEIVRVLIEHNASATFFLGGTWIRDHPENAKELAQNPLFELGNHSWSHADFTSIDTRKMLQEIELAQDQLFQLTGNQNLLFRLPYGFYTDEALSFIGENGLYTIQWDVVSGDPDPNIFAPAMVDWVLQQVQPGSIIIMHANGRGWHTAEALPILIQSLRDQGYTLVTISDLLNIQPP